MSMEKERATQLIEQAPVGMEDSLVEATVSA